MEVPGKNECKIIFKCYDINKNCVFFDGSDQCKYEHEYSISMDDVEYACESKIAQANMAILLLKEFLGEDNLKTYIANELNINLDEQKHAI